MYQTVNNRRELSCGAFMKEAVYKTNRGVIMPRVCCCHRLRIVFAIFIVCNSPLGHAKMLSLFLNDIFTFYVAAL